MLLLCSKVCIGHKRVLLIGRGWWPACCRACAARPPVLLLSFTWTILCNSLVLRACHQADGLFG